MSCQLEITKASSKRNLFLGGFTNTVHFNISAIKRSDAFYILEKLFASLLPELSDQRLSLDENSSVSSKLNLINKRGRQQQDLQFEEILKLNGTVFIQIDDEEGQEDKKESEKIKENFELSLLSSFKEYKKSKGIYYEAGSQASKNSPKQLEKLSILEILNKTSLEAEYSIDSYSFGLENFKQNFFGARLGVSPTIFQRIYLDYKEGKLSFLLEETNLKTKKILPLLEFQIYSTLEQTLKDLGFPLDIEQNISKKLTS